MFLLINNNTFVSGKVGWNDSPRVPKTAVSPCSSPLGLFHKVAHLCLDQRQKFHTDDLKPVQNLAGSYWLQMAVKRQMVKCKRVESTTKQSVFVEHSYSLKKKNHLSFVEACFRRTQNLSTIDQEKQKIQQIYIWNPFNHCQFNYVNIDFTSWVWNFCCLGTDIPPGKTSLAAILCRNSSNL